MTSNTKLTAGQKAERKALLADLPLDATMAMASGVTVLCVPAGKVTQVFSSVASADEIKIRRKVGEYHALIRWQYSGDGFVLPGHWTAEDILINLDLGAVVV